LNQFFASAAWKVEAAIIKDGGNSIGRRGQPLNFESVFDVEDESVALIDVEDDVGDAEAKGLNVELIRSQTCGEIIEGKPVVIEGAG